MITVTAYFAASPCAIAHMRVGNILGIHKELCIKLAEELCERCQVSYTDFSLSANGVRINNEGIDDSYTLTLYQSFGKARSNYIHPGFIQTYNKIVQWIARRTRTTVGDINLHCSDLYLKYMGSDTDISVATVAVPTYRIVGNCAQIYNEPFILDRPLEFISSVKSLTSDTCYR